MAESRNRDTVKKYVGDMIALESHIEEALDRQVSLVKDHPKASAAVRQFHNTVKTQRDTLKAHLKSMGGEEGAPLKTAVASLLGVAAGMVDRVRPEAVSKALRDDYTAFNHATMGYAMLHATALMLGEQSTADLAERHLRSYASAIEGINQIVADVVSWELRKDGHIINDQVIGEATQKLNSIWRETSPSIR